MDTSRSSDWTAQALVFSGRPDPLWTVDGHAVAELLAAWPSLTERPAPAAPPPLGYRGVVLRAPDGRTWSAFGGAVTARSGEDAGTVHGEVRDDPGRAFERRLLATAPPGVLPPVDLAPR